MAIYGHIYGHIWPYIFEHHLGDSCHSVIASLVLNCVCVYRVVLQTSLEKLLSVNFGQFLGLDGPYLALLGPLLASPASGLTPSTHGNPVSTRSRPIFDQKFFANSEKSYLGVLPPKIDSYGLGTIIERSASKFCISGLRRRVKRSSWSNFSGHGNPFHPTVAVKTDQGPLRFDSTVPKGFGASQSLSLQF